MTHSRYRLLIDDLHEAASSTWVVARTSSEAISLLELHGCPYEISFDHDLRADDTAMAVVKKLIETDLDSDGRFIPEDFKFFAHGANPAGKENIHLTLQSYLNQRATRH
ncbi:cyclic-phosphate processing receiver domain-containing protein [Paraburkholderia silviterrae]|uniref:Cyclic-phosphate processing Receiver domain-containing protein n=1 Tax=Paraburkholderia silviterrae TaxID=2528715 RepID=A0A4V2ZY77_9BURK|nr:cyclic-phosphate processing receiver domain-containing protein [Paraburkholderia silviterrae]TDG19072.1 hypothetical protein EYW47_31560 [Paraburkholderia silviterrae]